MSAPVTMYTTTWCGHCHRLRRQLEAAGIEFEVVDIEAQPGAAEIVESANDGQQIVPTLIFLDGTSMTNPSLADVQAKLTS